jgi:putative oxidoreductase
MRAFNEILLFIPSARSPRMHVFDRLDALRPQVLSLFRICVGILFVCHGAASLFGVLGGAWGGGTISPTHWPEGFAAVIQLVAGGLVLIGLVTRPAALLCSGSMAYAYFVMHQKDALFPIQNEGESAAMFSLAFLVIAVYGAGPWSVDAVLGLDAAAESQPEPVASV